MTLDGPQVELEKWQTIHMVRHGRTVTLSVGAGNPVFGVDSDVVQAKTPGGNSGLTLGTPLLIGWTAEPDQLHPQLVVNTGFQGCISQVLVCGTSILLLTVVILTWLILYFSIFNLVLSTSDLDLLDPISYFPLLTACSL